MFGMLTAPADRPAWLAAHPRVEVRTTATLLMLLRRRRHHARPRLGLARPHRSSRSVTRNCKRPNCSSLHGFAGSSRLLGVSQRPVAVAVAAAAVVVMVRRRRNPWHSRRHAYTHKHTFLYFSLIRCIRVCSGGCEPRCEPRCWQLALRRTCVPAHVCWRPAPLVCVCVALRAGCFLYIHNALYPAAFIAARRAHHTHRTHTVSPRTISQNTQRHAKPVRAMRATRRTWTRAARCGARGAGALPEQRRRVSNASPPCARGTFKGACCCCMQLL